MKELAVTVLIVDDFEPLRAVISSLLGKNPKLQIVAQASDGVEAVQKARQLQPSLILIDLYLPKLNGLEAAQQIRRVAPQSNIIFVTQETSTDLMEAAVQLGARGYVVKTKLQSELLKAIDLVLEGKQFIGTGLTGDR